MENIILSLDSATLAKVAAYVDKRSFPSRNMAIRYLLSYALEADPIPKPEDIIQKAGRPKKAKQQVQKKQEQKKGMDYYERVYVARLEAEAAIAQIDAAQASQAEENGLDKENG